MTSETRSVWLVRLAFIVPSVLFGFAAAIGLVWLIAMQPQRPQPPDMSKFERLNDMEDLSRRIVGFAGLHTGIVVYLDTYNPSFCGRSNSQTRTIFLNHDCGRMLDNSNGYDWHNVGILAQHIGHILNGHGWHPAYDTLRGAATSGEIEEAQEFAGWALHRLGATLPEAQRFVIAQDVDGNDIPADPVSLAAIERGWCAAL